MLAETEDTEDTEFFNTAFTQAQRAKPRKWEPRSRFRLAAWRRESVIAMCSGASVSKPSPRCLAVGSSDAQMMKTAVACGFLIAFASMGHAQSPATSNIAGQQARVDAQFKAWRTAVTQLLTRADIKALRLKPREIEAFTAVIMDDDPVARVDLADIVRR